MKTSTCLALAVACLLSGCAAPAPKTYALSEYHDDLHCRDMVKKRRELVQGEGPMTYEQCRRNLIESSKLFESMPGPAPAANTQVIINQR